MSAESALEGMTAHFDAILHAKTLELEARAAADHQSLAEAEARLEIRAQEFNAHAQAQFIALSEAAAAVRQVPDVTGPPLRTPQTAPLPSTVKLNLPNHFSGSRSRVPSFMYEVEQYVHMRQLEESVMTLLPVLLTGVAAAWWQSLLTAGTAPVTWDAFKRELVLRFGDPKLVENMREELSALKPGRAAALLRSDLERILVHLPGLPESERVWHFKSKLKGPTRFVLEQHDPQTLAAAFEMAETVERAARMSMGVSFNAPGSGRVSRFSLDRPRSALWSASHDQGPVPMELNAMGGERGPRASLTTEREKQALIKSNGCFYCRVPNAGHMSRECPQKGERYSRPGNGRGRGH